MKLKYSTHLVLFSFLMISGCSDNGILFRSVGSYETNHNTAVYLVGSPYEIDGITYTPEENYDYFDSGDAFWYTADKHSPLTANGEKYDPKKMTAMHKTLPLPSIVRITNLKNMATAYVRVNDRGPYDNNRIMDVSEATAKYLNFSKTEVTPIQIEIMALESQALKQQLQQQGRYQIKSVNSPLQVQNNEEKVTVVSSKPTNTSLKQSGETIINADSILYPGLDKKTIQNLKLETKSKIYSEEKSVSPTPLKQTQKTSVKNVSKTQNVYEPIIMTSDEVVYSGADNAPKYYVQIGAFSQEKSVKNIKKKLRNYNNLIVKDKVKNDLILHYVRIGPFKTHRESANVLDKIHLTGYPDARIILE